MGAPSMQRPGVETSETVLTRVLPALDEFAVPGADSTPLIVVTHDAVIRPLMLHIDPDATTITVPPTGSYQVLIYLEGRWRIDLIDQQPL